MRYKIYVDGTSNSKGKLLHDSASSETITKVENCVLTLEDSKAGSLNFDIDSEHPFYNSINRVTSYIDVYENADWLWSGRVMQEEIDINNLRIIYCEGELAYLNDTCQPQMEYKDSDPKEIVQKMLDVHNQRVDDARKFYLKSNHASFPPNVLDRIDFKTQYGKTLDAIQDLMKKYEWHVHIERVVENGVRKRFLVFTEGASWTTNTTQTIEFGKNLIDYTGSFDMSEIATVIIPLGQKISSAGQTLMGDKMIRDRFYPNQYFDGDANSHIGTDEDGNKDMYNIEEFDIPSTMRSTLTDKKYVYITCRNDRGHGMYFFRDRNSRVLGMKTAANSVSSTECIEEKVEIPVIEGPDTDPLILYVSGFSYGLDIRVNAQKEVDQVFDEYTTVESVNDGSVYVVARSINLFRPGLVPGNVNQTTGNVELSTERYTIEEPIDISAGTYTISWLTKKSSHEVDIYFYVKDDQGNLTYQSSESLYNKTTPFTFTIANDRTARFVFKRRDYSAMTDTDIYNIQLEKSNVAHHYESPLTPLDIYGWFERQVTWDDTNDPQTLYDRAVTYLKSGQFDKMTITVKAYDLAMMGYDVNTIRLGQSIRVTSKPHGLDRFFDVTKVPINISDWRQTTYTLGSEQDFSLTSSTNQINDTLTSLISGDTHNALIAEMKLNAVAQIIGAMNGAVTTLLDDNNKPIAHFYSQTPPSTVYWSKFTIADCQIPCLLLNYNGIGFFANGIGSEANPTQPTITLVNSTGQIVANAIAAGTMLADRIRGGVLSLEGYTVTDGSTTVQKYAKIDIPAPPWSSSITHLSETEYKDRYQIHDWENNEALTAFVLRSDPGNEKLWVYDAITDWSDITGFNNKPRWMSIEDAAIIAGDFYQNGDIDGHPGYHLWGQSNTGVIWPSYSWGNSKQTQTGWNDACGPCIGGAAAIGFAADRIFVSTDYIGDDPSDSRQYLPMSGGRPNNNHFKIAGNNGGMVVVNDVSPITDTIKDGDGNDVTVVTGINVHKIAVEFVNGFYISDRNA